MAGQTSRQQLGGSRHLTSHTQQGQGHGSQQSQQGHHTHAQSTAKQGFQHIHVNGPSAQSSRSRAPSVSHSKGETSRGAPTQRTHAAPPQSFMNKAKTMLTRSASNAGTQRESSATVRPDRSATGRRASSSLQTQGPQASSMSHRSSVGNATNKQLVPYESRRGSTSQSRALVPAGGSQSQMQVATRTQSNAMVPNQSTMRRALDQRLDAIDQKLNSLDKKAESLRRAPSVSSSANHHLVCHHGCSHGASLHIHFHGR